MADTFDILIIGAGIVGTACAREFSQAGLSVSIIERDTVGGGATAAGMGHIVVMDDSPAQLILTRYSQTLWDALAQSDPEPYGYTRCGTIWIAADAEEQQEVIHKHALYREYEVESQILDARQLYALEPRLRPGLAGGLLVPGDSVVYPPSCAARLLAEASRHDTTLIHGNVRELMPGGVKLEDGKIIQAGAVVLASGAYASELLPDLPLRPKKGHLAITDRYPGFVNHQLIELGYIKSAHAATGDSVSFNVQPRGTGQMLIGSSRQFDLQDSAIDYQILSRMLASAFDYLPGLAQCNCIRTWTGLRAATPDSLPLIGPYLDQSDHIQPDSGQLNQSKSVPSHARCWLATGHEGLGITTSLGTARLLAAQILGRPAPIPSEPYLPARTFKEVEHA